MPRKAIIQRTMNRFRRGSPDDSDRPSKAQNRHEAAAAIRNAATAPKPNRNSMLGWTCFNETRKAAIMPMLSEVPIFTTRMKSRSLLGGFWSGTNAQVTTWSRRSVKHLARIQNAQGIERLSQRPHHPHLGVAREFRKKILLGQANPVLSRDGAAQANGFIEDFLESFVHPMHFPLVAFVRQEGRMKIPVAHMHTCPDAQVVFFGDFFNEANHPGQFAARDRGVFENGCGGNAGQRAE